MIFWLWTPRFLLHKQVAMRRLLPGAVVGAVVLGGTIGTYEECFRACSTHVLAREASAAALCVSCHMPMTEFARMRRSDHSMRPPTPATTLLYNSPNACNLCHTNKDAAWADKLVREWRKPLLLELLQHAQIPALLRPEVEVARPAAAVVLGKAGVPEDEG